MPVCFQAGGHRFCGDDKDAARRYVWLFIDGDDMIAYALFRVFYSCCGCRVVFKSGGEALYERTGSQ